MFTKCHRCSNDSCGKFRCKICAVKHNETKQQQYKERKNLGLCITCGNKNDVNSIECSSCREKTYKRTKEIDKKRKEEGKCFVRTCKKLKLDSCKFCDEHQKVDLLYREKRCFKLIKNGLCTSCGSEKHMIHFKNRNIKNKHCQTCYLKLMSITYLGTANRWKELFNVLERQNFICPYTGDKLVLGINDSIDHILASSRYPEKKHDINNLRWVSREVNRMKYNYTPEEFINLIEKIYKYRKKMGREKKVPSPSP